LGQEIIPLMKKNMDTTSSSINNDIYNSPKDIWRDKDSAFNLLETLFNPVRLKYYSKIFAELNIIPQSCKVLDLGTGGGLFSEELAKTGFKTYGIDPSENAIRLAGHHAKNNNLKINYQKGSGESIPFANEFFDHVFSCDVLEHVNDLPKVISEISRVLKPSGCFFYETINRTFTSWLILIKLLQDWDLTAIAPKNLHDWHLFIRPKALAEHCRMNNLQIKENVGIETKFSILNMFLLIRKVKKGSIDFDEFAKGIKLIVSKKLNLMYMGFATKTLTD
jgi:2-polyprenyl-6-hydroxyphenyl methylase/3-demethylubiquinone-9 3-methyltransferase